AHRADEARNDPPGAVAESAGDDRLADGDGEAEDVSGRKLRHHCSHPIMRCGNQVANSGNSIRITSRIRSVITNGSTPMKIVDMLTSLITLLMTNTFMPTGGWISPSSTVITMMIPNQIGSKPS